MRFRPRAVPASAPATVNAALITIGHSCLFGKITSVRITLIANPTIAPITPLSLTTVRSKTTTLSTGWQGAHHAWKRSYVGRKGTVKGVCVPQPYCL